MNTRFKHVIFLTAMSFLCGMHAADGSYFWSALFGAIAVYDSRQIMKAV